MAGVQGFPPGTPRRRLGNFRTAQLAGRVRQVLTEAGIPSSDRPDPDRPEVAGRLLDRLVHLTGSGGNRVWVPRDRFRAATRALAAARQAEVAAAGRSEGDPGPGPRDATGTPPAQQPDPTEGERGEAGR